MNTTTVRTAPDPTHSTRRWLVLLTLATGGFAIGTTEFAAMSLLPFFARSFRVDEPTAGHAISAYALGVVLGAPTIAVFAAKLPRRTILIALMLCFGVANGLSALAPSYHWMLAFRFLCGLPHGAYFGVAALVAASLGTREQRSQGFARVMLGLTVATIIGVPAATALGQTVGWRWGFGIAALLALLTALLVFLYVPRDIPAQGAGPLRELGALRRPQVWLTLGIGAIGSGGFFAVYAYLASTLMAVTHASAPSIPLVFAVFGLGMTAANLAWGWAADRAIMPSALGALLWSGAALALYPLAAPHFWAITVVVFLIGGGGGLATILQVRLMNVAGDAQTLAAALNHAAFNVANALGPWLGGMTIAAGYGFPSTGWVGCALAGAGLVVWLISVLVERSGQREKRVASA